MKKLETSLASLVASDALDGSNQYLCDFCCAKTDADRNFCIRSLPPCLRINLQRFAFDFNTLTKQKARSPILAA